MFVRCNECGLHQPQVFFIFKGKAQCPNCHLGEEHLSYDHSKPDLENDILLGYPEPIGNGAFVSKVTGMGTKNLLWLIATTSNASLSMESRVIHSTLMYVGDSGNYLDHQALWTFPKSSDAGTDFITMKYLVGLVIESAKRSAATNIMHPYDKLLESAGFREKLVDIREQAKKCNLDLLSSDIPHTHFRIEG